MKKSILTAAMLASCPVFASYTIDYTGMLGFEDETAGTAASSVSGLTVAAGDTTASGYTADASKVAAYESDAKPASSPNASGCGDKYLSLATGSDSVWRSVGSAAGAYIDTLVQFTACASQLDPDELGADSKIAIWLDTDGALHAVAGGDDGATDYEFSGSTFEEDTWYRLTVYSKVSGNSVSFEVFIDGEQLATADGTSEFPSMVAGTTVTQIGFKGEGALDDAGLAAMYPFEDRYEHYFASGAGSEEDPFIVPATAKGLSALQALTANSALTTAGKYFQLADDIDMTGADAFEGIGTYVVNADGDDCFKGVFDGNGKTISNIVFTDRTYAGIFNQVAGGTIKNLTVENVSFVGEAEEYGGAMIVGNARPGTTLENLVSQGAFGSAESPIPHNAAGILCRGNGDPENPLTVSSCENKAAIYGSYTKAAGIAAILQKKNDTQGEGGIVFTDCTNSGAITRVASASNVDGVGGIAGYADDYLSLVRCYDTAAVSALDSEGAAVTAKVGSIVGWVNSCAVAASVCGTTQTAMYSVGGAGTGTFTGLAWAIVNGGFAMLQNDFSRSGANVVMVPLDSYTYTPSTGTTLNFSVDTTLSPSAEITLNVPEGTTVTIGSYSNISGVTKLTGAGRIVSGAGAYSFFNNGNLVGQSTWTGTLEIQSCDLASAYLCYFGNSNSSVCFNNTGVVFNENPAAYGSVAAIEVGSGGWDVGGSTDLTFDCALTGTGTITDKTTGTKVLFTGDATEFAGSIAFGDAATSYINFGSTSVCNNKMQIGVGAGVEMTVASGKTWSANDFMFRGTVTLDGNLIDRDNNTENSPGVVWDNSGNAVINANVAGAFVFGSDAWNGTYNVNYTQANNAAFAMPVNSGARTVINGKNGVFGGYPSTGSAAPTVAGSVTLNADWIVANGWTDQTTTFAKLSGAGDLTVNGNGNGRAIPYEITVLDAYTGTLGGNRGSFTVGTVNVTEAPEEGACVVKVSPGANGAFNGTPALTVAGEATGKTLVFKADADPSGLYLPVSVTAVSPYVAAYAEADAYAAAHYNKHSDGDVVTPTDDFYVKVVNGEIGTVETIAINGVEYAATATFKLSLGMNAFAQANYFQVREDGLYIAFPIVIFEMPAVTTVAFGDYSFEYSPEAQSTSTVTDIKPQKTTDSVFTITQNAVGTWTIEHDPEAPAHEYICIEIADAVANQTLVTKKNYTYANGTTSVSYGLTGSDAFSDGTYGVQLYPFGWSNSALAFNGTTFGYDVYLVGAAKTASAQMQLVCEVKSETVDIEPGAVGTTEYDTEEEAVAAVANVEIAIPQAVSEAGVEETAYKALFEASVKALESGKYAVTVDFTSVAKAALQTAIDEDITPEVAEAAASQGGETTVSATAGLYYIVEAGTEPGDRTAVSCTLATGGTVTLTIPNMGVKGFYTVRASATPVEIPAGE